MNAAQHLMILFMQNNGQHAPRTVLMLEKGLMFDPLTISHDDCINKIIEIVNSISSDQVVKAFLSSLSTRRLDWRSGIASYYIAKLITPHKYTPVESGYSYKDGKIIAVSYTCGVCKKLRHGVIGNEKYIKSDLNVLNFERIKWGGVRHGDFKAVEKYFGKYL